MNDLLSPRRPQHRRGLMATLLLILAAVAGAGAWWTMRDRAQEDNDLAARLSAAGIGSGERAAIEAVVHDYILEHPEILPQAMERLQVRETGERIASLRPSLVTPFPGAVLGNPSGTRIIVEFTDYACSFCKASVADLKALIAADPQLKVVIRELPILSAESEAAARVALGAASQGRYARFHDALFAAERPDGTAVSAAAAASGVDLRAARAAGNAPAVSAELARNQELARQLGIKGTPAWVIGDRLLAGAVGRKALEQALAAAPGAAR